MSEEKAPVTDPAKPGDNSSAGNEFRRARQNTKHSQADVAKALGVSRQTISRWESGERQPDRDTLEWLWRNRNQYASAVAPLTGLHEARGAALREGRAAEVAAKAARKEAAQA